jgi:hypothetical protein
MNELSTLAKFIYATATTDTHWASIFGTRFREQIIPEGVEVTTPVGMFVTVNSTDIKGAFGYRLYTHGIYQIKGVIEGDDFSQLEDCANTIDKLFDWQNQIDLSAGRPRCQEVWTDPDDDTVQLMIMSMSRNGPIKDCTYADGVNYCHLGGEYEIDYYLIPTP